MPFEIGVQQTELHAGLSRQMSDMRASVAHQRHDHQRLVVGKMSKHLAGEAP